MSIFEQEERINKLEGRLLTGIIQYEEQRESRMKKNKRTSEKCGMLLKVLEMPGNKRDREGRNYR